MLLYYKIGDLMNEKMLKEVVEKMVMDCARNHDSIIFSNEYREMTAKFYFDHLVQNFPNILKDC